MAEYWSVALSVITSLMIAAVSYGANQNKIENIQKELDRLAADLGEISSLYVAQKHFDFVVQSLQRSQDDMQKDIKQILLILSHRDDRTS